MAFKRLYTYDALIQSATSYLFHRSITRMNLYRCRHYKSYINPQIRRCVPRIEFDGHIPIIGINHRIKSPESLKEKIIRKKLYQGSTTPKQVLDKMLDI